MFAEHFAVTFREANPVECVLRIQTLCFYSKDSDMHTHTQRSISLGWDKNGRRVEEAEEARVVRQSSICDV